MKETTKKNIIIGVLIAAIVCLLVIIVILYRKERIVVDTMGNEVSGYSEDSEYKDVDEKVMDNYYKFSGKKILIDASGYGQIMIPVVDSVPAFSKDVDSIKSRNGRKYYVENSKITSLIGVDVSVHQDNIDWDKVKQSGVDFAMIRLGYRGYGTGEAGLDEKYEQNIKGAREAGLDAGVYFFSQAVNAKEAVEEAELVIDSIKGLDVNYPVVFDWELIGEDDARTDNIPVDTLTDCCVAFCETIKNAGYTPMIYQNKRTSLFKLDLNRLREYEFWLAEYNEEPTYYYNFSMWQYASDGRVPGISGNVDMNICFKDYAE